MFLLERNLTTLRPVQSAPLQVGEDVAAAAAEINARLGRWPAMQVGSIPYIGRLAMIASEKSRVLR